MGEKKKTNKEIRERSGRRGALTFSTMKMQSSVFPFSAASRVQDHPWVTQSRVIPCLQNE